MWSVCSNHDTHERFVRDGLTRPIQHGFSTEYHVTRTARTHPPTYTHARYATPRFTPRDKSLGFIATCHVLLRVQQAVSCRSGDEVSCLNFKHIQERVCTQVMSLRNAWSQCDLRPLLPPLVWTLISRTFRAILTRSTTPHINRVLYVRL